MGIFKKMKEEKIKEENAKILRKKIFNIAIVAVSVLLFIFLFKLVFNDAINNFKNAFMVVFIPIAIAWFLSYMASPIEARLNKFIKNRIITVVLSICIVCLILVLVVILCVVLLYNQIYDILSNNWKYIESLGLPSDISSTITLLYNMMLTTDGKFSIETSISIITKLGGFVGTIVDWAIYITLVPIFMFFIVSDKHKVFNGMMTIVPDKYEGHVRECGRLADKTTTEYIKGRVLAMIFVAISFAICYGTFFAIVGKIDGSMTILEGIGYGLLFGIILGFLDIIPYLGPFLGVIIPAVFSFIIAPGPNMRIIYPLIIVLINLVIQFIENNIFIPKVMEKETELNALLVLCSILFFGSLLGAVGMILAVPIVGTIKGCWQYFKKLKPKPMFDTEDEILEELSSLDEENIESNE